MRVNAQTFFNFCASHVALLRDLAEQPGELSEAEVMRVIRGHPAEELPDTTCRRLKELQILTPFEPGSELRLFAEPVRQLLQYLLNEANPATPEMIRGYIESLAAICKRLKRAMQGNDEDLTVVEMAFREINQTLRRIYADLEATHQSILAEVAQFKISRQQVSVREKFRRIVHWMERFLEPMIEVIRADGPMRAAFEEVESLLRSAREQALFNDIPALERNLRYLRLISQHALRVFQQCRKEIQPLYESLRRSSFIAEGAAIALDKLQRDGIGTWGAQALMPISLLRFQFVPGDAAIEKALRHVVEHPPAQAPILELGLEDNAPGGLVRRMWLDSLPERVSEELPIPDLLGWLARAFPEKDAGEILSGFTALVFNKEFLPVFNECAPQTYSTGDAVLEAPPVHLSAHE
jgi:hypothetical protein